MSTAQSKRASRTSQTSKPISTAPSFRPGLSAAQVDRELKRAVQNWRSAEQCVVLWFAELHRRQLYKKLGFGTIHLYAAEALGFSRARSYQLLKLAERLKELPTLHRAVASGELGWTKARAVATVATVKTQEKWLEKAQTSSRRELEREIDRTKRRVRAARAIPSGQMALGAVVSNGAESARAGGSARADGSANAGNAKSAGHARCGNEPALRVDDSIGTTKRSAACAEGQPGQRETIMEAPLSLNVAFTPEQFARYEALVAQLRRRGHREAKGGLLLAALDSLLTNSEPATARTGDERKSQPKTTKVAGGFGAAHSRGAVAIRVTASPYQIHIHHCPRCESAVIATSRGDQPIDRTTLEAALCDARLKRPGQRTRSTLPSRLRRQALERDRHRCRMPGCEYRQFLAVHHIVPREDGGTHELSNLITLCGSCHRALHELRTPQRQEVLGPVRRRDRRLAP